MRPMLSPASAPSSCLRGGGDGEVWLSMADDGCGMDKTVLLHVFAPVFTTKEPGEGRGLGLSICYRAIREVAGHIAVLSAAGQGSELCGVVVCRILHGPARCDMEPKGCLSSMMSPPCDTSSKWCCGGGVTFARRLMANRPWSASKNILARLFCAIFACRF